MLGPYDSMGCILLRPISMPRISGWMKINSSSIIKGPILALLVTGLFIAFRPGRCAEAGAGVIQANTNVRAPTLETLQRGLEDMLDRLNLTHAQREQVEQIMAGEALQLQMARGNPNLSAARVFAQEQVVASRLDGRSRRC
jgi:hypothetical protein